MTDFDLPEIDRLLTTTKQVRKRLDLSRPVPRELILECIDIAQHAPMGGNLERNRWLVVDDRSLIEDIAPYYQEIGRPYLEANAAAQNDEGQQRVIDSAHYLVEHIAEVPAMVIAMRLDRLPEGASNAEIAGYHGSVAPGVWSFQLAARARGLGSAWTTFHLAHEPRWPPCSTSPRRHPGGHAARRVLHGLLVPAGGPSPRPGDHLLQPVEAHDLSRRRST